MKAKRIGSLILLLMILGLVIYRFYASNQSELSQPTNTATVDNGMSAHTFGKELFLDAKTAEFADLAALQTGSEEIVLATKVAQHAPTVNYVSNNQISIAYTLSDFRVSRVVKGKALTAGQDFVILENEAYDARRNLTYHIGNYVLMDEGASYLLFLRHSSTSEVYLVQGGNAGRVALSPSGRQHLNAVMAQVEKRKTLESREILARLAADKKIQAVALARYRGVITAEMENESMRARK